MILIIRANRSKTIMPFVSISKKIFPFNSRIAATSNMIIPAIAVFLIVDRCLNKKLPNIMTSPWTADIINAFIFTCR